MEVLTNYNLLGNILSFLNPVEILSSIPLVNKLFNHTSRSYGAIEKSFSDMISDIFGIKGPKIENPAIKIFAGLFNQQFNRIRLIFSLRKCATCGRFINIDSFPIRKTKSFYIQKTQSGPINHREVQKVKLSSHGKIFTLMIGSLNFHFCANMNGENKNQTWEENTEGFYGYKNIKSNGNLSAFIRLISDFEKKHNEILNPGLEVSAKDISPYISVGKNILLQFKSNNHLLLVLDIIKEKCIKMNSRYNEVCHYKSRKRIVWLIIELMQCLIKSGRVLMVQTLGYDLCIIGDKYVFTERLFLDKKIHELKIDLAEPYESEANQMNLR